MIKLITMCTQLAIKIATPRRNLNNKVIFITQIYYTRNNNLFFEKFGRIHLEKSVSRAVTSGNNNSCYAPGQSHREIG